MGLLELAPDGNARLIPITILIDGKYYDASAYKAAPVPMALWSETVYEAFRTGVSQGLFTVTGALQKKEANATEWLAEGTWQSADSIKARVAKKKVSSVPRGLNCGVQAPKSPSRRSRPLHLPRLLRRSPRPAVHPQRLLRRLHPRHQGRPLQRLLRRQLHQPKHKRTSLQRTKLQQTKIGRR